MLLLVSIQSQIIVTSSLTLAFLEVAVLLADGAGAASIDGASGRTGVGTKVTALRSISVSPRRRGTFTCLILTFMHASKYFLQSSQDLGMASLSEAAATEARATRKMAESFILLFELFES